MSDLESVSTEAADDNEEGASDTASDTPQNDGSRQAVSAARKEPKVIDDDGASGTPSDPPRITGQRKEQGHGSKRAEQGYGSTRAEQGHGSTNSSSSSDSEPEAAYLVSVYPNTSSSETKENYRKPFKFSQTIQI